MLSREGRKTIADVTRARTIESLTNGLRRMLGHARGVHATTTRSSEMRTMRHLKKITATIRGATTPLRAPRAQTTGREHARRTFAAQALFVNHRGS